MARKAAHDQLATPASWSCTNCIGDDCFQCIDTIRARLGVGDTPICKCRRQTHSIKGEHTMEEAASDAPGYRYLDSKLEVIWTTSVPKDDEAAVAYFHSVMRFGPEYRPVYVQRRNADFKYDMLPFRFDPDSYTTTEMASSR